MHRLIKNINNYLELITFLFTHHLFINISDSYIKLAQCIGIFGTYFVKKLNILHISWKNPARPHIQCRFEWQAATPDVWSLRGANCQQWQIRVEKLNIVCIAVERTVGSNDKDWWGRGLILCVLSYIEKCQAETTVWPSW